MRFATLAEFPGIALTVVLAVAVLLPAIGALRPLAAFPLAAWGLFFALDATSTRRIYRLAPDRFGERERNWPLVELVERLGFSRAIVTFLALVEIPTFLFISLVVVPLIGSFLFSDAPLVPCLGSGAGVLALAHVHAWMINRRASA